jgi:hypothetical protein
MAQWPLPMTRVIKLGRRMDSHIVHATHGGATCTKGQVAEQNMKPLTCCRGAVMAGLHDSPHSRRSERSAKHRPDLPICERGTEEGM